MVLLETLKKVDPCILREQPLMIGGLAAAMTCNWHVIGGDYLPVRAPRHQGYPYLYLSRSSLDLPVKLSDPRCWANAAVLTVCHSWLSMMRC